jgi:hypothetical protein
MEIMLIHLGSLIGTGVLFSDTAEFGKTAYSIHVWLDEKSKLKRADGKIEADDYALDCAMAADSAHLRLRNGCSIEIVLKPHRLMVGRADFLVRGAVPGF